VTRLLWVTVPLALSGVKVTAIDTRDDVV